MGCGTLSNSEFTHLVAIGSGSGALRYQPLTGWIACIGLEHLRAVLLLRALSGNFQCTLAVQTAAARTDKPDAWASIDQMTAVDRCTGDVDLTSTTASKMYVRFGVAFNLISGSNFGWADVQLRMSYSLCGALFGSTTLNLIAPDTSTYFVPVGDWRPVPEVTKLRYAVIVSGSNNGFKHKVTYRAATIEPEVVTVAWGTDSLDSFVTGDTERNTGDLALPTTGTPSVLGKMWVQPGIAFSGAGAGAFATVTVLVGGRPT